MTDSGLITGTPTKAKAAKISFTVSNDYGKETRTLTLNVCKLPEITTQALKDATVAKKYKETIKSSGSKPLTWELEGHLPQGITLFEADNAKLLGTPPTNDSGMVRVTLSNPVGEVSKVFTLNVNAIFPKISPKSLKAGKFGKQYSKAIKVKGTEPITLLLSGDLPEGLSIVRHQHQQNHRHSFRSLHRQKNYCHCLQHRRGCISRLLTHNQGHCSENYH